MRFAMKDMGVALTHSRFAYIVKIYRFYVIFGNQIFFFWIALKSEKEKRKMRVKEMPSLLQATQIVRSHGECLLVAKKTQ
jgi:hypothetical protein